jgi:tape measure domain-containing protein
VAVETIAEAAMVVRLDFTRAAGEIRRGARMAGQQSGQEMGNEFGRRLNSTIGGFKGRVASTMGALTSIVGGAALAGVVTFGLKSAASLEQAQVGFETLLGSGKKATVFLSQLQKFAASTPFELPGLIDASRTLLGVGVNARDVIPMLTAFGNTAGAVGVGQEAFQRIMIATSQAISAGKFQAGDLNQIMNNGIPIWSILAKATGKPVPELRKMASAGKLLSKDVLPALQKEMQKDYGGAMARQSKTLAGVWSTLKDSVSIGLANALKPMIPLLSVLIPKAADMMGRALAAVSKGVAAFAQGLDFKGNPRTAGFIGWLNTAGRGIGAFVEVMRGEGATGSKGFVGGMERLADVIRGQVIPAVKNIRDQIVSFVREHLVPALMEIRTSVDVFVIPAFARLRGSGGGLVGILAALVDGTKDALHWMNEHKRVVEQLAAVVAVVVGSMKAYQAGVAVAAAVTRAAAAATKAWTALLWLADAPVKVHNAAMAIGNSLFVTRIRVMAIDMAAWVRSTAAKVADIAATVAHRAATVASLAVQKAMTVATKLSSAATVVWAAVQNGAAVAARVARVATMALWTTMRANPIGAIITIVTLLVAAIIYLYKHNETARKIIDGAWHGIQAAIRVVSNWFTGTILPSLHRAVDQLSGFFRGFGKVAATIFHGWQTMIKTEVKIALATFNGLKNFITKTLPDGFKSGVAAIGKFWHGLQDLARKPVSFVVNSVINPLFGGIRAAAKLFGTTGPANITGFAEGGQIPGAPSSRDNRIAWLKNAAGKTISNISVATGEFVVNARDTAKALPLLRWINDGMKGGPTEVARRVGRRPVDRMGDGSEGWAFASGGLVGFMKDVWGAISDPIKLIKNPIEAMIKRIPGSGIIRDMLIGMGHKVLGWATNWLTGAGGSGNMGGNVGKAQAFARANAGKPYVWASAGPGGFDCSGIVSAVYNVLKGKNPYSHTFSTGSLPGPWFKEGARTGALVAGWAHPGQRGASASVGHMAGSIGGMPFSSTGSRGVQVGFRADKVANFAHIGAARAHGGLVELAKISKADFGQVTLAPGNNLVYNGLGHPEPLATPTPPGPYGEGARMHPDDIDALATAIGTVLGRALLGTVPATLVAARKAGRRPGR